MHLSTSGSTAVDARVARVASIAASAFDSRVSCDSFVSVYADVRIDPDREADEDKKNVSKCYEKKQT